jgi:ketosteroid isomerase-like protein
MEWEADVVSGFYAALTHREVHGIWEPLAEDVVWRVPGSSEIAGVHRGKACVIGMLMRALILSEGTLELEVERVTPSDHRVEAQVLLRAIRGSERLEARCRMVHEMEGGLIVEVVEALDDVSAHDRIFAPAHGAQPGVEGVGRRGR